MELTGDAIAEAVQQQFDKLPQKRKPQDRDNGVWEWVPLSGIVAQGTYLSRDILSFPSYPIL
jgi:tRNA-specific adenosine deaminase 1